MMTDNLQPARQKKTTTAGAFALRLVLTAASACLAADAAASEATAKVPALAGEHPVTVAVASATATPAVNAPAAEPAAPARPVVAAAAAAAAPTAPADASVDSRAAVLRLIEARRAYVEATLELLAAGKALPAGGAHPAAGDVLTKTMAIALPMQLLEQAQVDLATLATDISQWEQDQSPNLGSSRPNGVLEQAKAFGQERKFRRRLQEQQEQLLQQLRNWSTAMRGDLQTELDWLAQTAAALPPAPPPAATASAPAATHAAPALTSFEYYEVKDDMSLAQVCARPEIYGDSTKWEQLLAANRDKISDPTGKIPKGTLLLVPPLNTPPLLAK